MNRFSIDEDGCHETLKIYYLENTLYDYKKGPFSMKDLTEHEGQDHT